MWQNDLHIKKKAWASVDCIRLQISLNQNSHEKYLHKRNPSSKQSIGNLSLHHLPLQVKSPADLDPGCRPFALDTTVSQN